MWADLVRFENLCLSIHLPHPTFGVGETWPLDQDGESLSPDSIRHCLAARKRTQTDGTRTSLENCPFNEKEIDRNIIPRLKAFYTNNEHEKNHKTKISFNMRNLLNDNLFNVYHTTFSSMFSNTSFMYRIAILCPPDLTGWRKYVE